MKKITADNDKGRDRDDLLPEYHLDYRKAKPNRFAGETPTEGFVLLVEKDIAEVFPTPESIKGVLRALIAAMPERKSPKPRVRRGV